MLSTLRRFYLQASEGQCASRMVGTLFFLSAVSLGLSEHDMYAFIIFSSIGFSFISLGIFAGNRANTIILQFFAAALIIYAVYLAYSNPA